MTEYERVKRALESELLAGVKEIYVPRSVKPAVVKPAAGGASTLEELKVPVLKCVKCPLAKTRTNVVFGEGNPRAKLMFIGEAPGADEDEQARPFVGRAGQLLTKIIEAMGLKREDVYIANILKCRPPENRNPLPEEIESCSPYLLEQVRIIGPRVICALGKFSSQTLLNTETPISKLRGNFHDYHGTKLMPTYHPAYLLRNPSEKKTVWEDMKMIAKELGIKIPEQTKG
jgi:uracil-DNA glycosylase family 4